MTQFGVDIEQILFGKKETNKKGTTFLFAATYNVPLTEYYRKYLHSVWSSYLGRKVLGSNTSFPLSAKCKKSHSASNEDLLLLKIIYLVLAVIHINNKKSTVWVQSLVLLRTNLIVNNVKTTNLMRKRLEILYWKCFGTARLLQLQINFAHGHNSCFITFNRRVENPANWSRTKQIGKQSKSARR